MEGEWVEIDEGFELYFGGE